MTSKEKLECIKRIASENGYEYDKEENGLYYFHDNYVPRVLGSLVCKESQIEFYLKYGITLTKKEIELHIKNLNYENTHYNKRPTR